MSIYFLHPKIKNTDTDKAGKSYCAAASLQYNVQQIKNGRKGNYYITNTHMEL